MRGGGGWGVGGLGARRGLGFRVPRGGFVALRAPGKGSHARASR